MLLREIVADFPTKEKINGNVEIKSLNYDVKKFAEKSILFCLNAENAESERYWEQAVKSGAVAVVTEKFVNLPEMETVIVENVRRAFSVFSAVFYGNPEKRLKIVGVVGTNGKTSVCHILGNVFGYAGIPSAVIGTLGAYYKDYYEDVGLTTPDPTTLFKCFAALEKMGAEYVFMEVSAHAVFFDKVYPIFFEDLVFTNCTQDHLDFFNTFENYSTVKKSIFKKGKARRFIVNSDDRTGIEILGEVDAYTYATESPGDVFAMRIKESSSGISYVLNAFDEIYDVKTRLLGRFNVYNTLACLTVAKLEGVSLEKAVRALKDTEAVDGRMERVAKFRGADIYVDYAHTPDGLEKCLTSIRRITKGDLYCVFGCGGNRDRTKRKVMGRIAGDIADYVIVTSDNPRFEDPDAIIRDVEIGVRESSLDYICIKQRDKAISYAVKSLSNGDALLIAGKGAENYQEVMGIKHPFSDKEVVLEFIDNK